MQPCGDWRIKLGGGVSRRSNSANANGPHAVLDDALLARVREVYRHAGLPAYVRLPSILRADVGGFLQSRGFAREGDTLTLAGPLPVAAMTASVELTPAPAADWLAASNAINGRTSAEAAAFDAILARLQAPAAFAAVRRDGQVVSLAYGALQGGWLCVEAVATAAPWRGQGFAGQAVGALMTWGGVQGAATAALQVSADNAPARALYARLGFGRELYRYHYRKARA
jgi:RimJ/RimL family protein N-acetyltransferase